MKGYGICKLTTEVIDQQGSEAKGWENEIKMYKNELVHSHNPSSWYSDLKKYLVQGGLLYTLTPK